MNTGLRAILVVGLLSLAARPAQAHSIGVRDGGGSTAVCDGSGDPLAAWEPLDPDAEFLNNCFVEIFSIDFQLGIGSLSDGIFATHPPEPVEPSDSTLNIFDTLQLVTTPDGPAYRFFSSQGNTIDCDTCSPVILLFSEFVASNPEFVLFVESDGGDTPGWARIVAFNQEPIPEPATLLLLGTGLGGVLLKRRRRR